MKDKLKKLDKINLNGVSISKDSIKFKNQSSSTKLSFEYMDEISNKIVILSDKLKPKITSKYIDTIKKLYNDNIKLSERINIPSSRLRGFEFGKTAVTPMMRAFGC